MKKQTAINFIAQTVAFAINFCISFFLTPYIIEHIGVEANGFVTLANNFIDYAQLFTVALNSMAGRFITIKLHQKNIEEANKYFTSVVFANLAFSVVFSAVFAVAIVYLDKFLNIGASSVSDIKILWSFIALNFVLSLFASTYSVSTFVTDRLDKTAISNVRGSIIRAAALVICYSFFRPYTFYVGIATLLLGLNNLISHICYKNRLTPELRIQRRYFDFAYIKELISSGIWNSITKLSSILASGLDLLISNIFVGGVAMGVLNLSKTFSNVILSLFGTIAYTFVPQLTLAYANNDFAEMKRQLIFSVKVLGLFSSIPIACLFGFGKAFYQLWVPMQDPDILYVLTAISCLNLIFTLPMETFYYTFTVCNKVKISSIALILFSTASIITVFAGISFIQGENAKIIYIASVGAFYNVLRLLTFMPIYSAKCLDFKLTTFYPPIFKNALSVVVLSVFAFALNSFVSVNSWIMFISVCAVTAIVGIAANMFTLFSRSERAELMSLVAGLLRRK